MTRCRCAQCNGAAEPEEQEYCEDGLCGVCPGCLRAQDDSDRQDWEYERKRDREMEEEWERTEKGERKVNG